MLDRSSASSSSSSPSPPVFEGIGDAGGVVVVVVGAEDAASLSATPFRSTKNRVVLSSRSSMFRASTSRPSSSAAAAELMAALSPDGSASASSAARLVLLTSTVSMPRSRDPRNIVHCPKACGWLYTRRTCDIGCEGRNRVVGAHGPLAPASFPISNSVAPGVMAEFDVGVDDVSDEGGCGDDGSRAMWPTRQWCTSR